MCRHHIINLVEEDVLQCDNCKKVWIKSHMGQFVFSPRAGK